MVVLMLYVPVNIFSVMTGHFKCHMYRLCVSPLPHELPSINQYCAGVSNNSAYFIDLFFYSICKNQVKLALAFPNASDYHIKDNCYCIYLAHEILVHKSKHKTSIKRKCWRIQWSELLFTYKLCVCEQRRH